MSLARIIWPRPELSPKAGAPSFPENIHRLGAPFAILCGEI
jgi:hypothetical protein